VYRGLALLVFATGPRKKEGEDCFSSTGVNLYRNGKSCSANRASGVKKRANGRPQKKEGAASVVHSNSAQREGTSSRCLEQKIEVLLSGGGRSFPTLSCPRVKERKRTVLRDTEKGWILTFFRKEKKRGRTLHAIEPTHGGVGRRGGCFSPTGRFLPSSRERKKETWVAGASCFRLKRKM